MKRRGNVRLGFLLKLLGSIVVTPATWLQHFYVRLCRVFSTFFFTLPLLPFSEVPSYYVSPAMEPSLETFLIL